MVRESGVKAPFDQPMVRWVEHSIATHPERRLAEEPREFDALVTDLAALGASKLLGQVTADSPPADPRWRPGRN